MDNTGSPEFGDVSEGSEPEELQGRLVPARGPGSRISRSGFLNAPTISVLVRNFKFWFCSHLQILKRSIPIHTYKSGTEELQGRVVPARGSTS